MITNQYEQNVTPAPKNAWEKSNTRKAASLEPYERKNEEFSKRQIDLENLKRLQQHRQELLLTHSINSRRQYASLL